MELFKDSFLLLVAVPAYVVLIGVEVVVSYLHDRPYYTVRGTLTTAYLAVVNVGLDVALRAIWFAVLAWVYRYHLVRVAIPWAYWIALLGLQEIGRASCREKAWR